MRLLQTLLAQAAFVTLAFTLPTAEPALADGFYVTRKYLNGTREVTKLDISTRPKKHAAVSPRAPTKLSKRWYYCGSQHLDNSGVDQGVQDWKDFVEDGEETFNTFGSFCSSWAFVNSGVQIFYFIDAPSYTGHLDLEDINYALEQMDYYCVRYNLSTFKWDGSPEGFGKNTESSTPC